MTKTYELPNDHRMIVDIDETTRTCTITETQLDNLISKLNYYAEQTEVLDKIRDDIYNLDRDYDYDKAGYIIDEKVSCYDVINVIDKYREEQE